MEVVTILAVGFVCVACFLVGAKVGQTVSKDEPVVLPEINPVKAVKDFKAKKEEEMEQDRINIILRNAERYDGTPFGQEDVPGR